MSVAMQPKPLIDAFSTGAREERVGRAQCEQNREGRREARMSLCFDEGVDYPGDITPTVGELRVLAKWCEAAADWMEQDPVVARELSLKVTNLLQRQCTCHFGEGPVRS